MYSIVATRAKGRVSYNHQMDQVRLKEKQVEDMAHVLDDAIRIPGTSLRFGLDPLIGLVPLAGDVLMVVTGAALLLIARQLRVPFSLLLRMSYNQLLNGLLGSIPALGDLYSFGFKSHAKNTALLIRAVKQGEEGTCQLVVPALSLLDVGIVLALTAPIVLLVGYVNLRLWQRNYTILSFFF